MGLFFRKTKVMLLAPLTGTLIPLEKVADKAFAQKMLGDGVAVQPEKGELVAPCDGQISYVPDTAHAIALTEDHGMEILIHLGLNTVAQQGAGFKALVKTGDRVKAGQPLIAFDREKLAACGCDLSTPMVDHQWGQSGQNGKSPRRAGTGGKRYRLDRHPELMGGST